MELRLKLIIYILEDKYNIIGEVKNDRDIHHIRQFRKNKITYEDTLYVMSAEKLPELLNQEKSKGAYFLIEPQNEKDICTSCIDRNLENRCHIKEGGMSDIEVIQIQTNDSEEEVFDHIQNLADDLRIWDFDVSKAVFERSDIKLLADYGKKYLKHEYAVIDQNFNFIYKSSNFQNAVNHIIGEDSDTIENGLIVEKQFHKAAAEKGLFYYYSPNLGFSDLCKNVFVNDHYFARVLMQLDRSETEISAGEYYIFDVFSDYISKAMENLIYSGSDHFTDPLHDTCRKLIGDIVTDVESVDRILNVFGWRQEDQYVILKISFYENNNWGVHQKLTMAHIAKSLERKWLYTCALPFDNYIYWIINESKEKISLDSREFNQQIKLFLRDNVCNAGVSSSLEGFMTFRAAAAQSEYALKLGRKRHPEQWYYMFEDYRSDCIADIIQKGENPEVFIHPALNVLKKYDLKHESELFETLHAYLECNFNMTKAAGKINIHRTTFCRRMDQIRKLTKLDLENSEVMFQLLISYRF